jgi:replicative DNA helicase
MADGPAPERARGVRVPPHSLDAEASLLGAMLLRSDAIAAAVEVVHIDDFYKPAHAHIFDAVCSLYAQGEAVDPITVAEELRRADLLEAIGGSSVLLDLQASTPAISNAAHYARIVEENALLRRLINVAGEIAEMGYDLPDDVTKAIDRAEAMVFEVAQRRVIDTTQPLKDLLGGAIEQLEKLYERGETITGLATGYVDLDELLSGLQPSTFNVVGARPSMGKCVAWDTLILDPATGALHTVAELHDRGRVGEWVQVVTLNLDGRLAATTPSTFVDDGVKPVFAVRTALGRHIRATATHPFLTPHGWRPLGELGVGEPIAVAADLPFFGVERLAGGEVVLLAHVLGLAALGTGASVKDVAVTRAPLVGVDAISILRRHGLWASDARDVELPDAVYRLPREQLAFFLDRLIGANRSVWVGGGDHPRFACRSERFADGLAHLLLRFGIACTRRVIPARRAGVSAVIEIDIHHAGPLTAAAFMLARRRVAVGAGAAAGSGAGEERARAASVWWDEIVQVRADGHERVFDLTIPVTHNFVAADIVVHNTAFALGMAAHVAVEVHRPVLLFSLEMGQRELVQRILSSEARVDSQKLRTGRLSDGDWTKIVNALGRLEAPLWIDDNPNVTVMEIRAKARRLKSRLGDLGLIVVDYLQLMTGRGNAENRQVEVSEISRGLKILARELEVPVVALSQLSRALEMRADKRPMLADLRESGSIEQDADVVMFLYRDELYNQDSPDIGTAEVHVAKHRNGPTGMKRLAFIGSYTRFANMAKGI